MHIDRDSSVILPALANDLKPREYQQTLFKQALCDNSVVMLETGTGKTLVAVMLIQWFAQRSSAIQKSQPQNSSSNLKSLRKKVRVFLNNTVSLVHQQAKVIAQNTGEKVSKFVGSTSIDGWDESRWSVEWESASVLVMTHQLLLNALRTGVARITDIDLLVFDECHHARGNHPYALIMREFYDHCPLDQRPHVFGTTASPLNARQDPSVSVQNLKDVLDSQVCTVDLTTSTKIAASQRKRICYEYRLPPEYPATPLTLALSEQCGDSPAIEVGLKVAPTVLSLLGPFGVDQMWHHYIYRWHCRMRQQPFLTKAITGRSYMKLVNQSQFTQLKDMIPNSSSSSSDSDGGTNTTQAATSIRASSQTNIQSLAECDDEDVVADSLSKVSFGSTIGTETPKDGNVDMLHDQDPPAFSDSPLPMPVFGSNPKPNRPLLLDMADNKSVQEATYLKLALEIDQSHGGYTLARCKTTDTALNNEQAAANNKRSWDDVSKELTPQVNCLLRVIYEWQDKPDELRGIVFTSRRISAILLVYIISHIAEFSFIKADVLLGVSRSKQSMDQPIRKGSAKHTNEVALANFASGALNLIFATQVAEEGVDIQPCNLVIRFNMPSTVTSLIQSRGRARMANSQFIVMVPEIDEEDDGEGVEMVIDKKRHQPLIPEHSRSYTDYMKLEGLEECLRDWCMTETQNNKNLGGLDSNVEEDSVAIAANRAKREYERQLRNLRTSLAIDTTKADDSDESWAERRDNHGRIYVIASTQARITYLSAIQIIHKYVQILPQDLFCKLAPTFHVEEVYEDAVIESPVPISGNSNAKKKPKLLQWSCSYRCTILFPSNSAIRKVVGPIMPKKKLARQAAAYRAAKRLHQLRAIDDNLMPITYNADDLESGSSPSIRSASERPLLKKIKGAKSTVCEYDMVRPQEFLPPSSSLCQLPDKGITAGSKKPYRPFAWHLYSVSFKHPACPDATWLVFVTAQPLPDNTSVPLCLSQYTPGFTELDPSATFMDMDYLGSQTLSEKQVNTLANFTSKMLMRLMHMALCWEAAEIGIILAPISYNHRGIDYKMAEECYRDRKSVFNYSQGNYGQWVSELVVDGLDHGKLKVVTAVCPEIDIFSNMCSYHNAYKKGESTEGPWYPDETRYGVVHISSFGESSGTISDMAVTSNEASMPVSTSRIIELLKDKKKRKNVSIFKYGSSSDTCSSNYLQGCRYKRNRLRSRDIIQTMADWAVIKRASKLTPDMRKCVGVPVFRVREVELTFNYLSTSLSHVPALPKPAKNLSESATPTIPLEEEKQAFPNVIYSSPFYCAAEPLDMNTINNLSLLPSFFTRLEHVLIAAQIKRKLKLQAEVESVRQAITATCAGMDVNYERLETLGDSVLKLVTSVMLFITYPDEHEGLLTSRRTHIVSNANLFHRAHKLGLENYIITQPFVRKNSTIPGQGWSKMLFIPGRWICTHNAECAISVNLTDPKGKEDSDEADTMDGSPPNAAPSNQLKKKVPRHNPRKSVAVPPRSLSEKMIADIAESLLGASVVDGGFDGALAAARSMGLIGKIWTSWSKFQEMWSAHMSVRKDRMKQLSQIYTNIPFAASSGADGAKDVLQDLELDAFDVIYSESALGSSLAMPALAANNVRMDLDHMPVEKWMRDIEDILGYTFKDHGILNEAMTHCSSTDMLASSYQRLEYLGDAILDYLITKRYYDFKPALKPYRLTLVKHVACSNNLFALIVACHRLHRHLRHNSDILGDYITDYELRLDYARNEWADNNNYDQGMLDEEEDARQPWDTMSLSTMTVSKEDVYANMPPECWNVVRAPKVLGDIFESLIGAVFVDSGMDMAASEAVYQRLLCPFLDRFVDRGKLSLHPVLHSQLICQGWGCGEMSWETKANPNVLDYVGRYIGKVKAHGVDLAVAVGESPRHAKFNAGSAFLTKVSVAAPNTLYGDLDALSSSDGPVKTSEKKQKDVQDKESKLDKILRPICNCMELRKAAMLARELEKKADSNSIPE